MPLGVNHITTKNAGGFLPSVRYEEYSLSWFTEPSSTYGQIASRKFELGDVKSYEVVYYTVFDSDGSSFPIGAQESHRAGIWLFFDPTTHVAHGLEVYWSGWTLEEANGWVDALNSMIFDKIRMVTAEGATTETIDVGRTKGQWYYKMDGRGTNYHIARYKFGDKGFVVPDDYIADVPANLHLDFLK